MKSEDWLVMGLVLATFLVLIQQLRCHHLNEDITTAENNRDYWQSETSKWREQSDEWEDKYLALEQQIRIITGTLIGVEYVRKDAK